MILNYPLLFSFLFMIVSAPLHAESQLDIDKKMELLKKIIGLVKQDHVQPKNEEELFKAAVNGMLSSLDPHSTWLDPKTYEEMQISTRGKFGGLGIEVTMDKGLIKVVAPIAGTPADIAGMLAGDLITHLDAKPVLGLTLSDAVQIMRGPPQTKITLTVKREGSPRPIKIDIIRAIIEIKAVVANNFGKIAYLRLTTFNEQAAKNLVKAIHQAQGDYNPEGYILDLRNNPGGLLDQAISVSDLFLQKGEIVSIRGRSHNNWARMNDRFYAQAGDITEGKPVIVLINGGSASASEIVAGALQDHHRATTLGTLSFGKGSVQTVRPLGAGKGALRLTTARYYTPLGRSIQAQGVLPDIIVRQKIDEKEKRRLNITGETDLPQHLAGDNSKKRSGSSAYVPKDQKKDTQLNYAIDLLNNVIAAERQMHKQTRSDFF